MEPKTTAKKILSDLNYDFRAFTIDHFINSIEQIKQRRIFVFPWDMPSGWFGAWMTDGEEPKEYIFYRDNVPELHQIHIQLHELSHFLWGHPTTAITRQTIKESKTGDCTLPFNALTMLRSPEISEYEFEAEYLASLIQEQAIRNSHLQQLTRGISSYEKIAESIKDLGLI